MSMFKNTVTGDVTSVFGPVHDNFVLRADEDLIFDDRDGKLDPLAEGAFDAPAPAEPEPAPKSSGAKPDVSQTNPDVDGVDTSKE